MKQAAKPLIRVDIDKLEASRASATNPESETQDSNNFRPFDNTVAKELLTQNIAWFLAI